jgi:hypothetical protein
VTGPLSHAVAVRRLVTRASRANSWAVAAELLDQAAHIARQAAAHERAHAERRAAVPAGR